MGGSAEQRRAQRDERAFGEAERGESEAEAAAEQSPRGSLAAEQAEARREWIRTAQRWERAQRRADPQRAVAALTLLHRCLHRGLIDTTCCAPVREHCIHDAMLTTAADPSDSAQTFAKKALQSACSAPAASPRSFVLAFVSPLTPPSSAAPSPFDRHLRRVSTHSDGTELSALRHSGRSTQRAHRPLDSNAPVCATHADSPAQLPHTNCRCAALCATLRVSRCSARRLPLHRGDPDSKTMNHSSENAEAAAAVAERMAAEAEAEAEPAVSAEAKPSATKRCSACSEDRPMSELPRNSKSEQVQIRIVQNRCRSIEGALIDGGWGAGRLLQ